MDINKLIEQAKAATEKLEDQTEVQAGGDFEYETPPAGPTPARFVGYVELGSRAQRPYQGKEKPDCDEVRLIFELNGSKHKKEVGEGDDKKTITNVISVRVAKKLNEKATFYKLFKKMLYGRSGITHMSQMLGEAFIITVTHNTVKGKDGAKDRTYANMRDEDGSWLIGAPVLADPLSGETKPVPVPEATKPIQLLLWDAPSQEQWDSIFIDGTRTVKGEDGTEREVSKNWLQEDIVQNAKNFEGSALQAMLGGIADLTLEDEPQDSEEIANEAEAPSADDALAALGL